MNSDSVIQVKEGTHINQSNEEENDSEVIDHEAKLSDSGYSLEFWSQLCEKMIVLNDILLKSSFPDNCPDHETIPDFAHKVKKILSFRNADIFRKYKCILQMRECMCIGNP